MSECNVLLPLMLSLLKSTLICTFLRITEVTNADPESKEPLAGLSAIAEP
jgi:hypothetical protein